MSNAFALPPLIRPVELSACRRSTLRDGTIVAADDVFAMFVAARHGQRGMVPLLLQRGADPAARTPGAMPLAWAEGKGYGDVTPLRRTRVRRTATDP